MKCRAIARMACFSPNSVDNDAAILSEVVSVLRRQGCEVDIVAEEDLNDGMADSSVVLWLSMGRLASTAAFLTKREAEGAVVLNSAAGVEACTRSRLHELMRREGIPMPPDVGDKGYWLKRGDAAAQDSRDVCFVPDGADLRQAIEAFSSRGITDVVVSAHVEGDLVKFYGVEGTGFFRTTYPTADGFSKFGDEERNGAPHYYDYDLRSLQAVAERLSRLTGTPIYGGDCIVRRDGSVAIIDFNDWPSFKTCRQEAAGAIVGLALSRCRCMGSPVSRDDVNRNSE